MVSTATYVIIMLLCCFREPKKDKDELSSTEDHVTLRHVTPTRVTKHQQLTINNSQIILTTSELPSADCENVQIHAYQRCPSGSSRGDRHSVTSQTPSERSLRSTPRRKERYPPSKDEKRILKQRSSQELLAKSAYNLPYIDQSPDRRRISDSQGKGRHPFFIRAHFSVCSLRAQRDNGSAHSFKERKHSNCPTRSLALISKLGWAATAAQTHFQI